MDKSLPTSAGNTGLIPGLGRSHTCEATKPKRYSDRALTLETVILNNWVHMPQLLKVMGPEPVSTTREGNAMRISEHHNEATKNNLCSPQPEKARAATKPVQPKIFSFKECNLYNQTKSKLERISLSSISSWMIP